MEYNNHNNYDDEDNDKHYSFMDQSSLRRNYNILEKEAQ